MTDCIFLGRKIGTYSGWDGDMESIVFYDFIPVEGIPLIAGTITISMIIGNADYFDDEGKITNSFDLVPILASLPKNVG